MKLLIAYGAALCLCQFAAGGMHGPMYPPTNGVVFSFTGNAGDYGGQTNTYTGMSMEGVIARWWGDAGAPIVNSLRGSPLDAVSLNINASSLDQGVAVFLGTSPFTFLYGTSFVTTTVPTRLTIRTFDMLGSPVPMVTGMSLSIAGEVVAQVDSKDFRANLLFEARNPVTGVWTPTSVLYNSFSTQGQGTYVSFNGGFYESQPTPCPADYNQDGGVDGTDVQAFFADWEGGMPAADVNEDGGVDGSDVQDFFVAWENGGC
ncbi:MAG: hypothetical protein JSR77_17340 [Planctomycetes bacterium]|nr:hypothetical protein [Planctomycetota bacterium]